MTHSWKVADPFADVVVLSAPQWKRSSGWVGVLHLDGTTEGGGGGGGVTGGGTTDGGVVLVAGGVVFVAGAGRSL
jgi:hypothetical protein